MGGADPALVEGWVRARSLARGLPRPVADAGGWRVDSALPAEQRRHVFAAPCDGLRMLGHTITMPHVLLKLCADDASMRALLPPRWQIESGTWMMTCARWTDRPASLAPGYRADLASEGPVISARILADDGAIAASGYAAADCGFFVYDRIVTAEAHRRRGLGVAIMTNLASRRSGEMRQVLVATEAGRSLYETLGWSVHSPYTSAFIPEPDAHMPAASLAAG